MSLKSKINFQITSIPVADKIIFVQNLALMVKTGFSIGDALLTLSQQVKRRQFAKIIADLQAAVVKGNTLASALREHSETFDELFINMVAAGESSGNLEPTLFQLVRQLKKSYALKKKIRNAMIYPTLILSLMLVVGVGMFVFVVPRIMSLYTEGGYGLPWPTQLILNISNFVTGNAVVLGVIAFVSVLTFMVGVRTDAGKLLWHRFVLHIPIAGPIIKRINVARFSRVLNSLIATDIPIVRSFEIIASTVGNRAYRKHLLEASALLAKGNSLYSTFSPRPDLFEPLVAQMIKVGEEAGVLDTMTEEIASFYEEEVDSTMSNLTVIIEPVLMVLMGVGVGFLAVAIVLPIYSLVNEI